MLRPISDLFLNRTYENSQPSEELSTGSSATYKESVKDIQRVEPEELELMYLHNQAVFGYINRIVEVCMACPFSFKSNNPKVAEFYNKFFDNAGRSSGINGYILRETWLLHACIFGRAFVEKIPGARTPNRIVDLGFLNPRKVDYARDTEQKIVFDKQTGKPVGYFQKTNNPLPMDVSQKEANKKLPDGVVRPPANGSVFIPHDKISDLQLFVQTDPYRPLGVIEPVYKMSLKKMNVEDAMANAIYRLGFPILAAKIGDMNHEPNPNIIKGMQEKLKDLKNSNEIAFPYYVDVMPIETRSVDRTLPNLEYFNKQEIRGIGVPAQIAEGEAGGGGGRAIRTYSFYFTIMLQRIVNRLKAAIIREIIIPLNKQEGFTEIPVIEWEISTPEEEDITLNRVSDLFRDGVLGRKQAVALLPKKYRDAIKDIPYESDEEKEDRSERGEVDE